MKTMKISNQPLKGYADWKPEEFAVRKYIFEVWTKVCKQYGYKQYLTPVLENADIYRAKSGEDVGGKELMIFKDRGGRELAIRPEMTPSVTRLVTQTYKSEAKPIRLFSIANFVRNQKPQRGRNREFWQLNYDIFGCESINADIEVIKLSLDMMLEFNPPKDSFILYLNNRKLIDAVLNEYAELDAKNKVEVVRVLDKKEKLTDVEYKERLEKLGLSAKQIEILVKFSDSCTAEELKENIKEIEENKGFKETVEIVNRLEKLGYGDWIEFNPSVIRGFDYYDGVIFEVFDKNPENKRSLFGGGRYNGLAGIFGEESFPAVGCAPGDETLKLFLEAWDLLPKFNIGAQVLVTVFSQEFRVDSVKIADKLRESGVRTQIYLDDDSLGNQFSYADKKDISYVIIFGPDEKKEGFITLKNFENGEEKTLNLEEAVKIITEKN